MSYAIPVHIAIVDDTKSIPHTDLARLVGSLNSQIQNDFSSIWHVIATVGFYPEGPSSTWAIHIQNQLDDPNALGYHTDDGNQPIAFVELTEDYSVTVSHEMLEMLADPFGNRTTSARLPAGAENSYARFGLANQYALVQYLVETCDPPEAASYPIAGIEVSDFLLPPWYRSAPGPGYTYSHTGACSKPRQVADGGYVSFGTPSGEWFQIFNQGSRLSFSDLGKFNKEKYGSIREWTDEHSRAFRSKKI